MAIFMAVFLFFLAVALVATNRQDILLSLSVDHRLRAEVAARSGANLALQTMRTDAEWESKLARESAQLASGASHTVKVSSLSQEVDSRQPAMLEIKSRGTSGFVSVDYRLVTEEFRICDEMARKNVKPHMFAVCNVSGPPTTLMMMGPSFKWSSLTPLGEKMLISTLAACGSMVYMNGTEGVPAPKMSDYTPIKDSYGFYNNGGFQDAPGINIPKGQAPNAIELVGQTMRWKSIADPNDFLGKVEQATIDNEVSGRPRYVEIQLPLGGVLRVDISLYIGPQLEFYTIDGMQQACEGDRLYCHGTHFYYQGFVFQNNPVVEGMAVYNRGRFKEPRFYKDDCILIFDASTGRWSTHCDCLKVTDKFSEPYQAPPLHPNKNILVVTNQNVFSLKASDVDPFPIRAQTSKFLQEGRNDDHFNFLLGYQGQARVAVRGGALDPSVSISGLPRPIDQFSKSYAQVKGDYYDATNKSWAEKVVVPLENFDLTLNIKQGAMCIFGNEVYAMGWLSSRFDPMAASDLLPVPTFPGNVQTAVLLHFDGKRWQVWPGGAYQQSWDPLAPHNAAALGVITTDGYPKDIQLGPITMAGYVSPAPLMRRYVPISAERL